MEKRLFTSESVTEGHPDKICDQIADAILDEYMKKDVNSKVACEVAITTDFVLIMGEITSNAKVNIDKIVRDTIRDIGYDNVEYGFDCDNCNVIINIDEQSTDIALGVDKYKLDKVNKSSDLIGAGDQGMMFGYATDETSEMMPYPIYLAHKLTKRLTEVRKNGILKYLRPDGKSQVTVEYDSDDKPVRIEAVVISTQHNSEISQEQLHKDIRKYVIDSTIPPNMVDSKTKYYINPTGRFVIGGPHGDSGLTGRKIIVDTYGGYARHGGGAFSGKDCTKVDRSAAYMARYIAKNIVAAEFASKCQVSLAYAIGVAEPVMIEVDTFGTGKVCADDCLAAAIPLVFGVTPVQIMESLRLNRPIFRQTAVFGHFGRKEFPWERTDKVLDLQDAIL